jgi:hypothetical protein
VTGVQTCALPIFIARFGWSPELWYNLPLSFTTTELQILPTSSSSRMPDEFFQMWVKVANEEAKHFTKWTLRLQSNGTNVLFKSCSRLE